MLSRWFVLFSAVFFTTGLFAQSAALTCVISAVPTSVRSEGIAERTGDIVLACSGGAPGGQVSGNLVVGLNVNVTNRIQPDGSLDATLTVNNGSTTTSMAASQYTTNAVAFNGVVFNASPQGSAELRITNLRGNASQLGFVGTRTITAVLSFSGAAFPNATILAGIAERAFLASSSGRLVCDPAGSPLPDELSFSELIGSGTRFTSTRITEGFVSSFATRTDPDSFRADSGTRIIARYTGFPSGARLFVPDAIAGSTADTPTAAGDMGLTPSGGEYTAGRSQLLLVRLLGTDATGAGGVFAVPPPVSGTATFDSVGELPVSNGTAFAVYEVVDSNPFQRETALFPTFLGLPPSSNRAVETGFSVNLAPVSTIITQSSTAGIPRFIETAPPPDCSTLNDCNANYFPRMVLGATSISLTAPAGARVVGYLPVRNQGGGVMRWNVTINYGSAASNYLILYPSQGTNNGTVRIDAITAGLAEGTYQATIALDAGPLGGTRSIPVTLVVTAPVPPPAPTPTPTVLSIANAADGHETSLVPGSLATIMGSRLTGTAVQVTFDGTPASLLYTSENQVNLEVPAALAGKATSSLLVSVDGISSPPVTVSLATAAPAIFPDAVLNQDYLVNSESNAARTGSIVQIFATGLPSAGLITAKIHDRPVPSPYYAGPAPGLTGVQQVNIFIPQDLPTMQTFVYVCGGTSAADQVCSPARKIWLVGE